MRRIVLALQLCGGFVTWMYGRGMLDRFYTAEQSYGELPVMCQSREIV